MKPFTVRVMRTVAALLFPFITCWVQWQFWTVFKPFVWFLFFPTVFFSSRIGGKFVGLVSTVISALLVVYFFIPPQLSFAEKNSNNLYSVVVFVIMGTLFSYTHDRLERAKLHSVEAQEAARIANVQLQEARIRQLQAEQKLTEDHLHRSEERFRSIFNNAPIAIGIGRRDDGRLVEVNDAWLQLYGFERQEVIGKTTTELNLYVRADDRDDIVGSINECGRVINREIQLRRKSGDIMLVQYSAELVTLGEELFLQVMMTDITEQKRLETELRKGGETLRKLYAAVDQSPTVVIITDRDGTIEFVNPRFCLTSGYSSEEVMGLNPRIQKGDTPDEVYRDLWATISDGAVWEGDFHNRRKDGRLYWEHAIISPIRNEFGVITHFMAIKEDITERKLAAEELQRKNAEIEQFLYIVSHDLRSPLVTVKTFLGYLENDMAGSNTERVSQDLQYIHGAADKMELLLNDLLKISRIGRVETIPARVSLREVLSEVMDTMAGIISERKVEIRGPESDLILFVDRSHLSHIWQNLIENAIKYCHDESIPRIELGAQQSGGETLFFARDNGIGIDPKYHAKIFGIFEKLDHKSSGTGLGLSMIQRIVEKYGGRVWVESEGNNTGACFYFTLPNAMVKAAQHQTDEENIHV